MKTDYKERLLGRLNAIARSLAARGSGLALIGLGSSGTASHRIDQYSDLDFFAIVKPGKKEEYLHDLSWLSSICPIAYSFRNTIDGFKVFFADGIFCEFAVFEPVEYESIPTPNGRIVWMEPGAYISLRELPPHERSSVDWLLGEILTNLYVGMSRFRRGEKISAMRFIQNYAVDRVIELTLLDGGSESDYFAKERRFEVNFPQLLPILPQFMQGYEKGPESALAILEFLEKRFEINSFLRQKIVDLIHSPR